MVEPAAPPTSPAEQPTSPATLPVQAAEAQTEKQPEAQAEAKPELSFPRRSPFSQVLIVASLHEPVLPASAKTAAPPASVPAVIMPAPTQPAAVTALPNTAAPAKPPVPAKTASKAEAPAPAKAAAPAIAGAKTPESEPRNAASSQAIVLDPVPEKKTDISRNFSAVEGARFEVPFEGTGWTYLGEKTGKVGIAYDSRRFAGTSLVFILNPIKAGDYILRFQKQDSLRGVSYEDLVGVTVAAKPARDVAVAPSAPVTENGPAASPASAKPVAPTAPNVAAAAPPAPPAVLPAAPAPATPEAELILARAELAAGHVQGALDALDRLVALAPGGGPVPGATDEAFMLYARALELNGAQKDIKRAYAYYKKVRDEYPESAFWDEAAARASYIERHYFDIR
jgi:hypothetical protein